MKTRGAAWDFNPRLPDFLPVFQREDARRTSFGGSVGRPEALAGEGGRRGEETSRRLSGLSLSPAAAGAFAGKSSGPGMKGRSDSGSGGWYDPQHGRPAHALLQQWPAAAPPAQRSRALSPSSAAAAGGGSGSKPRSSSTTIADLLALDRHPSSTRASNVPLTTGSGGGGGRSSRAALESAGPSIRTGGEAMALAAQTAVFDSPGQPTRALPLAGPTATDGGDEDGDLEMASVGHDDDDDDDRGDQEMAAAAPQRLEHFLSHAPDAVPRVPAPTFIAFPAGRTPPPPPAAAPGPPGGAQTARKHGRSSAGSSLAGGSSGSGSSSRSRSPDVDRAEPAAKRPKSAGDVVFGGGAPAVRLRVKPGVSPAFPSPLPPTARVKAEAHDEPLDEEGEDELEPDAAPEDAREAVKVEDGRAARGRAAAAEAERTAAAAAEDERKGPKPLLTAVCPLPC